MNTVKLILELEDFIKVSYPIDISERCANKLLQLLYEIKQQHNDGNPNA